MDYWEEQLCLKISWTLLLFPSLFSYLECFVFYFYLQIGFQETNFYFYLVRALSTWNRSLAPKILNDFSLIYLEPHHLCLYCFHIWWTGELPTLKFIHTPDGIIEICRATLLTSLTNAFQLFDKMPQLGSSSSYFSVAVEMVRKKFKPITTTFDIKQAQWLLGFTLGFRDCVNWKRPWKLTLCLMDSTRLVFGSFKKHEP